MTIDLNARERAEEDLRQTEERFRLLVESIGDYAIFMLDPQGRVQTWNRGAERIKQYAEAEIVGQHFSIFYPDTDVRAGKCERELEGATRDGRFEDEGWRVRKDGSQFWANVVITAVRNRRGELIGFAKITRDLTERMQAEEERLRLAQTEEALRLRDEFLSIASHELKTPLTALQLQLQRMLMKAVGKEAANLARAARASSRLAELVETLLDVSRISRGRFTLSRASFDLATAVEEVVGRMHAAIEEADCRVVVETSPAIGSWDRLRVEQVATNLISNAIKYATGTSISVEVYSDGGDALLRVTDRGPGVPEGDLDKIFDRYVRSASLQHYGGMGLGLYVSRQIVEAHGGEISAANVPGGGARFVVKLPLVAAATVAARSLEPR